MSLACVVQTRGSGMSLVVQRNEATQNSADSSAAARTLVTMTIANQLLGIPVSSVHDVLGPQKLTWIPLAPESVA